MDPLDTMTATDWRRCYDRSQEYATKLLGDLVAARRREAELIDRLRRRETRVREMEEENQELQDDLACGHRFHVGSIELYQAHNEEHTDTWTLISKTKGERVEGGIRAALARARQLKESE